MIPYLNKGRIRIVLFVILFANDSFDFDDFINFSQNLNHKNQINHPYLGQQN